VKGSSIESVHPVYYTFSDLVAKGKILALLAPRPHGIGLRITGNGK